MKEIVKFHEFQTDFLCTKFTITLHPHGLPETFIVEDTPENIFCLDGFGVRALL